MIQDSKITVALLCHKEAEKLALILEDIKQQTAFDHIAEVLLFQNGTCEKTKNIAQSFVSKLPLKIFSSPENNLGKARAFVVKQAQCDYIAWTDGDCRLQADWLKTLIHNWNNQSQASSCHNQELLAVGGPNRLPEDKTWKKIFNLSLSVFMGHGFSPQAWKVKQAIKVRHIPTSNGLFLKKGILKAGNFSKKQVLLGEDLELGLKMNLNGKLILCPKPLVINNFAETYLLALKRLFRFGTVQTPKNNRFFYLLLLFFPTLSLSLILSFFYIGSVFNIQDSLLGLSPIFNTESLLELSLVFTGSLLLKIALFFTGLYFLSLVIVSFIVLWTKKTPLALLLPFFWLAQHLAYSIGTNKRFLPFKKTWNGCPLSRA